MQFELWIDGRPRTKARPRMTRRGRVFTPEATSLEEDRIAIALNNARVPRFEGPVSVVVDYYTTGQFIQIRDWAQPKSRLTGDVDNYSKLTLDAIQKSNALADDKAVAELWVAKW